MKQKVGLLRSNQSIKIVNLKLDLVFLKSKVLLAPGPFSNGLPLLIFCTFYCFGKITLLPNKSEVILVIFNAEYLRYLPEYNIFTITFIGAALSSNFAVMNYF